MDGGSKETLVFQIPSHSSSFEYNNEELSQINALYRRSCFCPLSGAAYKVRLGTIPGEQLSAVHWVIYGKVMVQIGEHEVQISFDEPYYAE